MKQQIFWWIGGVALLLGLAVFGFAAFASETRALAAMKRTVRARFPSVRQLSTSELADWLADSRHARPQLLDVRKPEEFAVSHLPRAIQIDPEASAADVLRQISTNQPVVVYCSVGYRSSMLAARLMEAGFSNVCNLEGSIFAWANEQRPLERDGKTVEEVHPYNAAAARMLQADYRANVPPVK